MTRRLKNTAATLLPRCGGTGAGECLGSGTFPQALSRVHKILIGDRHSQPFECQIVEKIAGNGSDLFPVIRQGITPFANQYRREGIRDVGKFIQDGR